MIRFQGSPLVPRLSLSRKSKNPRLNSLFSIQRGIFDAPINLPDSEFEAFRPDDFTISQWFTFIRVIMSQVKRIKWKKAGE